MRQSLDEIAIACGTDKSSRGHGYCIHYERWLESVREDALSLLEIGIQRGYSHQMWERWMPNANIFGLDINPPKESSSERIRYFKGNQTDPNAFQALLNASGPLDIIIDDGSHISSDIIATLSMLWPYLKPGGFYFIEDLHVGRDDRDRQARGEPMIRMGSSTITALEYLNRIDDPCIVTQKIEIVDANLAMLIKM